MNTQTLQISRDELCQLPSRERLEYVERIMICYPRWNAIVERIKECHSLNTLASEPECMVLVGPTGAGKSTLVGSYIAEFPREITETGVYQPVVRTVVHPKATIANVQTDMLRALHDPLAGSGTIGKRDIRIYKYFMDCKVELLVIDELQHFVDRESEKVLIEVSNWLKTLIKETGVACLLIGLEREAELLLDSNPQLSRLFGDPLVLSPFVWDESNPKSTVEEFRKLLAEIDYLLPLKKLSNLSDREMAWRIYVATNGVINNVMKLLRKGTRLAIELGVDWLDYDILSQTFIRHLAGKRRGISNPFVGDSPVQTVPEKPYVSSYARATNRRSKSHNV
ncbi:MAG: TniB family NTP-binding protein [Anaerolineae bacterium]|nr:TniB family NTP-binding protein [Anaerolineae bacterium]